MDTTSQSSQNVNILWGACLLVLASGLVWVTRPISPLTLSGKLSFTATGAGGAVLSASMTANAAIVAANGTFPLLPPWPRNVFPISENLDWDVDGDGTVDFTLENDYVTFATSNGIPSSGIAGADFLDRNGGRLVVPAAAVLNGNDGIAKLSSGVTVGNILGTAYKFFSDAQTESNLITIGQLIPGNSQLGGWGLGETNFFGFRFTSGTNTHYGWGEMEISERGLFSDGQIAREGAGFQILRAFYENNPGSSIRVGTIPEPSSLCLLALGSAGLTAWRRRKKV